MINQSSAYIVCQQYGFTYHFAGVVSIEHNLALNIDNDSDQGGDIINGARNLPDQVSLRVIETDAAHSPGWSAQMLAAMASLKRNRYLCRVVTSMGTYSDMLLTEITATQDEENAYGWSGEIVFMKYIPQVRSEDDEDYDSCSAPRVNNNSSTRRNTGSAGGGITVTGTAFQQLLQRSGIC